MTYKRWLEILFSYLIFTVMVIMLVNFIIDPYLQFRMSGWSPVYFDIRKERHLNSGLAKNYDYQSIVLGSSYTRRFMKEEVESILGFEKTIKLSMGAATAYEKGRLLNLVLQKNSSVNVLYGLDVFSFSGGVKKKPPSFPEYLYDGSVINSLAYLTRFETIRGSLKSMTATFSGIDKKKFMLKYVYGISPIKRGRYGKNIMLRNKMIKHDTGARSFEILKINFDRNILPLIVKSKEANYIIFYPPYSIMAYRHYSEIGLLDDIFLFKKYVFESLRGLGNVQIFDFQVAKEMTHNLNNYVDYTHYNQATATSVLKNIKMNNYLVTKDNVNIYEAELTKQVESFSLEKKR